MNPDTDKQKRLPTRYADYPLAAKDRFRLDTPGGGGLGASGKRDPARVLRDVQEGYVTPKAADETYGVIVKHGAEGWTIDAPATQSRRSAK
jgi:N-methylhydantoinase B/oxoprolinase/acetone carboxylase alpha subunit